MKPFAITMGDPAGIGPEITVKLADNPAAGAPFLVVGDAGILDRTAAALGSRLRVLRALFERQGVTACGHETTDTDPGVALSGGDASLERYVLGTDHYQIELLAGFESLPEVGALLVAAWPKARRGSGFPARVFAVYEEG